METIFPVYFGGLLLLLLCLAVLTTDALVKPNQTITLGSGGGMRSIWPPSGCRSGEALGGAAFPGKTRAAAAGAAPFMGALGQAALPSTELPSQSW